MRPPRLPSGLTPAWRTRRVRAGVAALLLAVCLTASLGRAVAQTTLDGADQAAGTAAPDAGGFDPALSASVIGAGLRFMLPRTLEPYTAAQLALWGLNGLTAIDPSLLVSQQGGALRLTQGRLTLFVGPAPAAGDIEGWARSASAMAARAYGGSPTVRAAGAQAMLQSFFDEMFNHMDPYSRYVPPEPADAERDRRTGGAASAGISLVDGDRYPTISDVNANGPAWAAGVSAGWSVIDVDGRSTRGQPAAVVEGWMRGTAGTPLSLTLRGARGRQAGRSEGRSETRSVSLQRASVPPETVFAFRNDNILILRITGFAGDTAQEVSEFLDEATHQGSAKLKGVIIDLRGNRGGVLQQAVTTVALLLDRGVAVITRGRDPEANHVWSVAGGDLTDGAPIAILVDGRTASAAEVMAAALADQRRAVVIGSATLGKGLVQTIGQMPDGGELFVTWSRMLAPQGWPLQGLGVLPEICTAGGADQIAAQMAALGGGHDLLEDALVEWRRSRAPLPSSRVLDLRANCPAAIGTDADLEVARTLVGDPTRYHAALVPPQDPNAPPE